MRRFGGAGTIDTLRYRTGHESQGGDGACPGSRIRNVKKADWRGNRIKEREVRNAIRSELGGDKDLVDKIFEIVKAQNDY